MQVVNTINEKLLELVNRIRDLNDERGQTSSEYVAVTAVAVAIAISVIYLTLGTQLSAAVSTIGSRITSFVSSPPAVP